MPLYFFHVHDGVSIPDREGMELASWADARSEAIKLAGRIIADSSTSIPLGEDWSMTVANESGLTLFRLAFFVASAPALNDGSKKG